MWKCELLFGTFQKIPVSSELKGCLRLVNYPFFLVNFFNSAGNLIPASSLEDHIIFMFSVQICSQVCVITIFELYIIDLVSFAFRNPLLKCSYRFAALYYTLPSVRTDHLLMSPVCEFILFSF